MYICICNAVTEREIRQCARLGACSLRDLRNELGAANTSGKCKHAAKAILRETRSDSSAGTGLQPA